jgi:hypothetical protein
VALVGIAVSVLSMVFPNPIFSAILWLFYLCIYRSGGEPFYNFQWDILLVEVGFAAIVARRWAGASGAFKPSMVHLGIAVGERKKKSSRML